MSTVAPRPPAPPASPALLDSEQYIDDHIRRTRRALKATDLAAGVITLAVGLLGFLLAAALIDHWIVPGGLSPAARLTLFGALVVGVAWYGWRQFAPLVRSINPVYAAHAIEKSAPSLKNSLLNLLLFRSHRQGMSARVYHALQQQAAQRLSTAPTDGAIDRAALLRLGYALLAVIAACALYGVLSPKNLATSAVRILAPLADIAAPSRVQILNIEPGDASVARGERIAVSAEIHGAAADEPVRLRYSTADEQIVGETIAMTQSAIDAGGRFSAELPRASAVGGAAGVMQDLEYWIEAGDARSRRFRLSVFHRPTIVVQRLRYEFPAYTGEPSKTVDNIGDIRALEGTRVTVEALANQPIKSAHVDFDGDGTSDLAMRVDGDRAYATFELGLRPDRRTPRHASYVLRFTTTAGRTNSDPAQYRIEVTPDYAPEVRIVTPEEPELAVSRDRTVPINVEARDPDYAVERVRLVGRVGDRDVEIVEMLSRPHAGRFSGTKRFVPGDVQLVAGDVLEYWAEATDNRRPEANVAVSERRTLRIVDPDAADNPQRDPGRGGGAPPSEGDQGGEGEAGEAGGAEREPGEGGAEGQSGAGTPGGGEGGEQSEQGEQGEGEPSASGGEAGEDSAGEGAEGGVASAGGEESASEAGQSASDDQPGPSDGETAPGAPSDAGSAPSDRVSTEGDDDATAFQRIRERMAEQDASNRAAGEGAAEESEGAESEGAEGQPAGSSEAGEQPSAADPQPGGAAETQGEPSGGRRDPAGARSPSGGDASEGDAAADGETGDQEAGQSGDSGAPGEGADEQQGASDTPAGADGANNPNNGAAPAGDDEAGRTGAPEATNKKPGEDSDAADEGESGAESDAATEDSRGDRESDAESDTGGDRAGPGQPGGGQQADNPGEGEAGSHQDAETGAGASAEPGEGETGAGPGEDQTAEGETGQSSGDQPGGGSQSRETTGDGEPAGGQPEGDPAGGEQPGGASAAGEQPSEAGEETGGQPGAEQSAAAEGEAPGESGEAGEAGEQSSDGSSPGAQPSGGQPGEPADPSESPRDGESAAGASATPPTAGGAGQGGVDGANPGGEPGGEAANLEFARQQTDLVLERLDEQLANQEVDPEMLRRLGWTEDELAQFVARWREFQARAAADESGEAQRDLDAALRSLGLRPTGSLGIRGGADADDLRDLNDAARKRAPLEYLDRVRWYLKGAASEDAE